MANIMIQIPTADGTHVELPANTDKNGMVNLTALWKTFGSIENKDPRRWADNPEGRAFLKELANSLNVGKSDIYKGQRGKGGGSYGHYQVALTYLQYLSPKAQMVVNEIVKERLEEDANPDLAIERGIDRGVKGYRLQGKSDEWIRDRLEGKLTRKSFAADLAQCGVHSWGYAQCTNAIYKPLLGGTALQLKAQLKLSSKANLRDNLTGFQLSSVNFAEAMAKEKMAEDGSFGNDQCVSTCNLAGRITQQAIKTFMGENN